VQAGVIDKLKVNLVRERVIRFPSESRRILRERGPEHHNEKRRRRVAD
jgi:hypothetical protein